MPELLDTCSIVFQAACNEAVDSSLRPIRQRVLNKLADLCRSDVQVSRLVATTWGDAESGVSIAAQTPLNENIVEDKFIELIARNPRWRTVVLNAIVQERRWSDLWSRGHRVFSDRLLSFFEKLISPNHPVTMLTAGVLASAVAVLLAAKHVVSVDLKPRVESESELHLKVALDDKDLVASIRPIIDPNDLDLTFHPATDATLRITPQIQYPSDPFEKGNGPRAKSQGLGIRLIPTADLAGLPKSLWDPKSGLRVSVTQLDAPTDGTATVEPTSSKAGIEMKHLSRPLDKIETDLEAISGDFQAQSTIEANHGRATVVDATPNSVHSVELQWVGDDTKLQFCNLTLQVGNISADKVDLSVTKQQCSPDISLVGRPPQQIPLGSGVTQQLGPWILSVDEMRRRRVFQHAATLRFTWQPTNKVSKPGIQVTQKLQ